MWVNPEGLGALFCKSTRVDFSAPIPYPYIIGMGGIPEVFSCFLMVLWFSMISALKSLYAHRHWEGSADHRSEYNRTLPTQTASGTIREALAALRRPAQPSGDTQMARRITGASVVELYRCNTASDTIGEALTAFRRSAQSIYKIMLLLLT